ncbi:MAG: hypothetical protein ACYC5Y_04950 [Symbiobacteriia bacterium]
MNWLVSGLVNGLSAGTGVYLAAQVVERLRARLRRRNLLALLLAEIDSHVSILSLAAEVGAEHVPEGFRLETEEWNRSKAELATGLDPRAFQSIAWHYRSVSNLGFMMRTKPGQEVINEIAAAALKTSTENRDMIESLVLRRRKPGKHPKGPGDPGESQERPHHA